ncbi:CinA family protein [Chryseobacterium formosense]|uniref:CinA family protein n=1 Tax=Chryseobacterium formosense TaxID=236814 RepID=UPI000689D677|nr:nicotinamide-nucleotide amidohydrolase family protein [Chryseobacterium formosense]
MNESSNNTVYPDAPASKTLSQFIVERDDLFTYIGMHLLCAGESISTAESVTSGFIQFSFSQIKDASQFYRGGMTVYTLEEKVSLLKVDQDEAYYCDCVSSNIAETMALNVAKIYKTDWSIAITGYATPVEKSGGKLFAYFSIAYHGKILISEKLDLLCGTESVNAQLYYTDSILKCLRLELGKQKLPDH